MKGRQKTLVIVAAVIASLCLTTGAVYLNSELAVENEQEVQQMEQETNQATKDLLRDADTLRLEHASVVPTPRFRITSTHCLKTEKTKQKQTCRHFWIL